MTPNPIAILKRRRADIKTRITKFRNYLSIARNSLDLDELQVKIEALTSHFKNIHEIHEELMLLDSDSKELHNSELESMEDNYNCVLAETRKLIRIAVETQNSNLNSDNQQKEARVSTHGVIKLPEITLPKFDGSIEKWQAFKDKFSARIGDNNNIPKVDKLQYLQSCLTDKAARAVDSIESTSDNYDEAWAILTNKYDNSRRAILRHWSILHRLPRLPRDNPSAIDELIDTFRQHIRALKGLGEPVEQWDSCIIYLLTTKINENLLYQWETTLADNKMPSYSHLLNFLEKRGCCTENTTSYSRELNNKHQTDNKISRKGPNQGRGQAFVISSNKNAIGNPTACPACQHQHTIFKCPIFRSLSIIQRRQLVDQNSLCFNCLGKDHTVRDCKAGSCRVCRERHHTFLHTIGPTQPQQIDSNIPSYSTSPSDATTKATFSLQSGQDKSFTLQTSSDDIIPTALIHISHKNNTAVICRAIIDTGSTRNFITNALASMLELPKQSCYIPVDGLNNLATVSQYIITATIKSRLNVYQKTLDFLVVPNITSATPSQLIDRKRCNIPSNLQLADPEFHKPAQVQVLLGSGTTLAALCVGQVVLSSPQEPDLILQKTRLGWIIGGNLSLYNKPNHMAKCHLVNLQEDISRFWELEEICTTKHLSDEETECEKHFQKHIQRADDGRYIISLPFNSKRDQLGESQHMAFKRLQSLERRLHRNPKLQIQYRNAMNDYLGLGFMTKINNQSGRGFYLPHQAVFKESSLTTKVRVVFDASAVSSTGISLNDALLSGPTIQSDIFSLLLRFRLHNYVLTGDIEKKYLQIRVREEDQAYLRILWKEESGEYSTYQFNRLIFGLKPASFLATRCLNQLADDEGHRYKQAATILKRDLYVDDLLTGANTIDEVVQLRKDMSALLQSGGFNLRQCASNASEVLDTIPDCNVNLYLKNNNDTALKTLGVHWNSERDAIIYTIKALDNNRMTKRVIFSEVAKIFDPLGILNPVIVTVKLLMQDLWKLKIDWDESLLADLHTKWEVFANQLPDLNDISFDRKMLLENCSDIQLHGFCDASEKAYGACVYLRSANAAGHIQIQLYCAKSRVAPIKTIQTIPRLELCAAALLATLYYTVRASIDINISRVFFWTDSMIALYWINTSPHLLKAFAANRVTEIQSYTNNADWRHVSTLENPADLLTRGILPGEFKCATLWAKGPKWLCEEEQFWPSQPLIKPKELPEIRKPICLIASLTDDDILKRYSSYLRLQRIIAICLRVRPSNRRTGLITADELEISSIRILQLTQRAEFALDYKLLMNNKKLSTKSKLLPLNPFIDKEGLIRVGGRLGHSSYSYHQKHPIIIPKSHHITQLLIKKEHLENLHGGIQSTLCSMRQKYWPLDGRNQVRKVIRNCVRCARARPLPVNYVMSDLPSVRTIATRPFTNVGIDYCGPFFIKEKKLRNRNKIKVYVSIFICLSTKAVHLEVVSDLTTEAFIAALKRFISRRGKCSFIQSDNGTNFVGARNELQDILRFLSSKTHNEKVHNYLAPQGIVWRFNPPSSPHFGGIWEAAVKSFKHHLKRVVGVELFTWEQFNTLVVEIEAVLNSRPLTPISSDPNDLNVLTPSYFLIGDSLSSLPEKDLSDVPSNRLSKWQHIQKVKQDFWTRWHKEYINELNIRYHWTGGGHHIKNGTIVMLRDENLPPLQWRLGRVIETFPGQDGIIRTVRLKTKMGEVIRCVKKLAPLPIDVNPNN